MSVRPGLFCWTDNAKRSVVPAEPKAVEIGHVKLTAGGADPVVPKTEQIANTDIVRPLCVLRLN